MDERRIMKTKEIIEIIEENGGFDNFNNWNWSEVTEWVRANFSCSKYVAKRVAYEIK